MGMFDGWDRMMIDGEPVKPPPKPAPSRFDWTPWLIGAAVVLIIAAIIVHGL